MDTNPYEPPKQLDVPSRRNPWKLACLAGIVAMIASATVLIGTAEFRNGAVVYRHGFIAMIGVCALALGVMTSIGGSIGWLIAAFRRRGKG